MNAEQELNVLDPRFDPLATFDNQQVANRYALDHKLHVTFYTRAVLNPMKSTAAGRQVFDEVDYIKIHTPGSQLCSIDAPISAGTYLTRFGDRYKKWKAGQAELVSGTPIESFPILLGKVALVHELKAMNIHTVEQLAGLSDGGLQGIMGGHELRRKAEEYIKGTSGTDATLAKMQKENDELKAQMNQLMAMVSTTDKKPVVKEK